MIDLSEKIGLKVQMGEDFRLTFGDGVVCEGESVRKLSDLKPVVRDQNMELTDEPAYYMYRNVRRAGDEAKISEKHLRFDLTVIPPRMLGEEFIKTSGHFHPKIWGSDLSYPELYFVVNGQASYLMQKEGGSEVILARVLAGEAVLMTPNFGHVTVNEGSEAVVMANWVSLEFNSEYGEYETKQGGAYYLISENGETKFVKNEKYEKNFDLRLLSPKSGEILGVNSNDIYGAIDRADLGFLNKPQEYLEMMRIENLYE